LRSALSALSGSHVTLIVDGALLSGYVTSYTDYLRKIAAGIEKAKPRRG
jgi:hypothetical protein